jgi:hypothetical protein
VTEEHTAKVTGLESSVGSVKQDVGAVQMEVASTRSTLDQTISDLRSTRGDLGVQSGLIATNKGRLGKTLWTDDDPGDKVEVRGVWDGEAESRLIGEEIERARRKGMRYRDIAILVRASFQMRAFEERFVMLQIPYIVVGGPRFFERAEIRDAHAYLRLINSDADDLAFERIINVPKRGIGETTVQKLLQMARLSGISAAAAARVFSSPVATIAASVVFAELAAVGGIVASLAPGVPVSVFVTTISFVIYLVCWAISRRCSRLARRETTVEALASCWSR